jgi:hypothetical protein
MKTFIITLLFLSLTISSYSQEKYSYERRSYEGRRFTHVVIKSAGDDFSIYLPDRNADPSKSLR